MTKIPFENGELVQAGYVMIDGVKYETVEPVYNGTTPVSADILNQMQNNVESAINSVETLIGDTGSLLDNLNGEVV